MSYRLEFELEGLPRMTNPSGRKSTHWRVIKREGDQWKAAVSIAIRARRPRAPLHLAKLTLTRLSSVSPDPDGLVSGFKWIIDGLVLARVLENDRWENIGMPDYRWEPAPRGKGKIRVLVEEREEEK